MKTRKINGIQLEKMIQNGFANLQIHEQELNDLNVFPVPDGDTGTNMLLTLGNGLKNAESHAECGTYLKSLSSAMLLAARGNSGVILSQIFKGYALEVGKCSYLGPKELRNALIRGYRNAYAVTIQPSEGTILTVCREGIEHIRSMITRNSTVEEILGMYIAQMRKTLSYTPEMLSVLKEANVIDSGALGYIYIYEGMLKYMYGEILETETISSPANDWSRDISYAAFNEYSTFEDGYCMEFILQLMKSDKYSQRFQVKFFIEDLKLYGNSLVVVQDGMRVKVHIHTLKPGKVIALCQEFGEFLNFKLDNMQVQHNEQKERKEAKIQPADIEEHVPTAVVAVSVGKGISKLYETFGCVHIIEEMSSTSVSAETFLEAYQKCNADHIIVLPNDPNIIRAAAQAAELYDHPKTQIHVMETKSPAEGYFALAMDLDREMEIQKRLEQMQIGIEDVLTLSEVTASKDYQGEFLICEEGEETAILNRTPIAKGEDDLDAIIQGLSQIEDIEDREAAIVFRGEGVSEEKEEELASRIEEEYPLLELTFVAGEQKRYHWILGIM